MKRLLLSASLAVLALSSATAFADSGRGNHDDHGRKHEKHEKHGKHSRNDWQASNRRDYRRDDRRSDDHDGRHDNGRHLGWQKQSFRRGERIPVGYLQPAYSVQDYRSYRLAEPPRGYRWVRPADNRYLLVQTATGLISQILGY